MGDVLDWLLNTEAGLWTMLSVFLVASYGFEHWAALAGRRMLMWAAGLFGIGVLVWVKGAEYAWTWLLAAGWLGVLVYMDRKLFGASKPAPDEPTARERTQTMRRKLNAIKKS